MGAPSKRARKIRSADEFDITRLIAALKQPNDACNSVYCWSLADIVAARDAQMRGDFWRPAMMAAAMRTDDAIFVPRETRLDPQRCLPIEIEPGKGAKASVVANEAGALFGDEGVGVTPDTMEDINANLVDHSCAFGINTWTPREDGSRVDVEMHHFPIQYVRKDEYRRCFMARVDPSSVPNNEIPPDVKAAFGGSLHEVPIIHGDGRWVVFTKQETDPFKNATLLSACLVWARHAFGYRDWSNSSKAHGNSKVIGELPMGVALQKGGQLSEEAAAYIELLKALFNSDLPVGIQPAGAKTQYIANGSTAWQVFENLAEGAEKAAARIFLGTDGTMGAQGGAPGVDITELFGVGATRVEGDLACIRRCLRTGLMEPWTAINFGDSTLTPTRVYKMPDGDESVRHDELAKRRQNFWADVREAKASGCVIDQPFIDGLAKEYDITPPKIAPATPASTTPNAALRSVG